LKPKKTKLFITPVSSKLQVTEDLVKDLTSFYWKEVRINLMNLEHANLSIKKLGMFKAKSWRIDDIIYELKNKYEYIKTPDTIKKFQAKQDYLNQLENAMKIAETIKLDAERKKEIKAKRKTHGKENQH